MQKKGRFIVVEGLEGAGKSTVVNEVVRVLQQRSIPCIQTREPGGTPIAEQLRQIVKLGVEGETLTSEAELLLIYAARMELLEKVVRPALNAGTWVVSDRFELSTFAYQGGGRQLDRSVIKTLSKFCLKGFKPDHTFFLDLTPEQGLLRAKSRGEMDVIEQESQAFFSRVYQQYHTSLASLDPVSLIQASLPLDVVLKQVREALEEMLHEYVTS